MQQAGKGQAQGNFTTREKGGVMTDREMLEWAAKAYWGQEIGDVVSVEWSEADQSIAFTHGDNQDHNGHDVTLIWNSREDDGDAFRLAVKLGLIVETNLSVGASSFSQVATKGYDVVVAEEHGDDPCAATRLAITRAAAEIGKQMGRA